jgi:hypothetical protein
VGYLPRIVNPAHPASFAANGKGYMIVRNYLFEFDPVTLKWSRLSDLEEEIYQAYDSSDETVVMNYNYELFLIDPLSGNLTTLPSYLMNGVRKDFTGLIHDHLLYIGLGNDEVNCRSDFIRLNLNDLP